MSAKVLTAAAAKEAKIELIENGREHRLCTKPSLRCARPDVRFRQYKVESGRKSFRCQTVATKRNRPSSRRIQVVRNLAGGGVVFGPTARDYSKKVSKTTRRLALQKALSERIKAGDVLTLAKFAVRS
jgi:large subunit ribosomal protein L4